MCNTKDGTINDVVVPIEGNFCFSNFYSHPFYIYTILKFFDTRSKRYNSPFLADLDTSVPLSTSVSE